MSDGKATLPRPTRRTFLAVALATPGVAWVALSGAGCARQQQAATDTVASGGAAGSEKTGGVLRIGYGKGGSFNILRLRGTLEKRLAPEGVRVEWLNFPQGPQMMEAIGAGSLDLGSCAATPPIFAQAAGVPFVYVGNTPPGRSGSGGGILVPRDSSLRSIKDLRGKRIAFQPGSVWQYYLVKLLEEDGLQYQDIRPMKMPPADSLSAFTAGSVDAWVQGEPYLTLVQQKSGARVLASTSRIPTSGGFCVAGRTVATKHPEWIRAALEEVQRTGEWAADHPHEAATMTASYVGLDVATLERMIRQRENTELRPIDAKVIAQQQEQADLFTRLGVLPKRIDVRATVLPPDQNALLLPGRRQQAKGESAKIP